jgi:cell division septal protein FtsQ
MFGKKSKKKEEKKLRKGKSALHQLNSPYLKKPSFDKKRQRHTRTSHSSLFVKPPPRLGNQKPVKRSKFLVILLIILVFVGLIYILFMSPILVIKDYQIVIDETVITNDLKLNGFISEDLLGQNILLASTSNLSQSLSQDYPEIESITLEKQFPSKITIKLKKFKTVANLINMVTSSDGLRIQKKYLINSNGIVISENEENPELPYIRTDTEKAILLKTEAIKKTHLDYIIKLTNLFEEKFGLKIIEADYLNREREVHLKTEKDFYVWFDLNKDMSTQIEKLKKALPKLDIYKTPLEYIDLRIDGSNAEKVIFKRRKT